LEPIKYLVSGVTLNQADADDWNIRGFRTRGGFRNGMRSAFGGFASSTWDAERLEVLKGPAAMVSGVNSSAIGGTVNYITAKPTEDQRAWLSTAIAENSEWRLHAQASGPIWQTDDVKLLYRATAGLWNRGFHKTGFYHDENFYGGAFQARIGAKTVITLEYGRLDKDFWYNDSDLADPVAYAAGRFVLRTDLPGLDKINPGGPEAFYHLNNEIIEAELSHKFSSYLSTRLKYQYTVEALNSNNIGVTGYLPGDPFRVGRRSIESDLVGRASQLQWDLLSKFNTGPVGHELSGGLDYDTSKTSQLWWDLYNLPSIDIRNPDFSGDKAVIANHRENGPFPYLSEISTRNATSYSYYIQENISLFEDKLMLIGGWRWIDNYFNVLRYHPTRTNSETNARPLRVYRYGAIYKPVRGVSLYANEAINAFPSSGLIANPGTPFQFVRPDSDGEIREFGAKFNFFNGKLYGAIANFDLARTNVRSSRIVTFPDGTVRTIEAALDTTTKGWEFDLGSRIDIPNGILDIVGTYYDAISLTPNNVPAYNAPTYITSVMGKVTLNDGPLEGFTFGGAIRNESQVYMSAVVINQRPTVGSLFFGYRFKNVSANLNIDNVTDERYLIAGGPAVGEAQLPRAYRFSLRYDF